MSQVVSPGAGTVYTAPGIDEAEFRGSRSRDPPPAIRYPLSVWGAQLAVVAATEVVAVSGEPSVAFFGDGAGERDRWLVHMRGAIAEMAPPAEIAEPLERYFAMAAEAMRNRG